MNLNLLRIPDRVTIRTESGEVCDTRVRFEQKNGLTVFVQAETDEVCEVTLRWLEPVQTPVKILGDAWERGYGDLEWRGIVPERVMPWYILLDDGNGVQGIGVKVRPNAMCYWKVDNSGVRLILNVRCGGSGVQLNGRELEACTVVAESYPKTMNAFAAACEFCGVMCTDPLPVEQPIYGGNNWYYAYGNISEESVLEDARYMAELSEGLKNRPYMVIDDGWETQRIAGPWKVGNAKFPDMKALAEKMAAMDIIPGIWVRYLRDLDPEIPQEWRMPGSDEMLDPSVPEVLEYVTETTRRLVGWGYKLIKHDFTTFDVMGLWGFEMPAEMTKLGWHFADRSKTTAEILLNLYRVILQNAGEAKILGCNCIGHLCAGLVHAQRIGDDTSGMAWERTRKMGVNTLAFRLCENHRFFEVDADCVGITNQIPWELNRQWLDVLARSGSPLFISNARGDLAPENLPELKKAFAEASVWQHGTEPLDWQETVCPTRWKIGGETVTYDWFDKNS